MIIIYNFGGSSGHISLACTGLGKDNFYLSWGTKHWLTWGHYDLNWRLTFGTEMKWCKIPTIQDGNTEGLDESKAKDYVILQGGLKGKERIDQKESNPSYNNPGAKFNCATFSRAVLLAAGSDKYDKEGAWRFYFFPVDNIIKYAKEVKTSIKEKIRKSGTSMKWGIDIEDSSTHSMKILRMFRLNFEKEVTVSGYEEEYDEILKFLTAKIKSSRSMSPRMLEEAALFELGALSIYNCLAYKVQKFLRSRRDTTKFSDDMLEDFEVINILASLQVETYCKFCKRREEEKRKKRKELIVGLDKKFGKL